MEVRKDKFLERLDLVLEVHQVVDGFVAVIKWVISPSGSSDYGKANVDIPLIWIVDVLQTDVFLVLEQTIELGMMPMEPQFGEDEADIGSDESTVACRTEVE